MKNRATVKSPLYLIKSTEDCWKCGLEQQVIALATRHMRTDAFDFLDGGNDEPFLLSNITVMPQGIWEFLSAAFPQFQKRYSNTMKVEYCANTCECCKANFGDFYLFGEPDHAFFPMDEEQAARIRIVELPFTGPFQFDCSWKQGAGGFIFEHGKWE